MGVPAFYRWLSEKYPKIVQDVPEDRVHLSNGIPVPFDITRASLDGLETDHLYIDMNGIIHPCSHPEQGPQPTSEEEMYENVCRYVDRLMMVVRPRKLLYLAIDGVAPRAKMNQQRSRRFRSAQEARELLEVEHHVRDDLQKQGHTVPPPKPPWDSNVITPGTTFMLRLSEYIRFYVRKRISQNKAWSQIKVIFSDASIPGEGEHKIMNHIRLQRSQMGYDPNLVHVLHGLDADLIMLALATHELHFYILREIVTFGRKSVEQMERRQNQSGFTDKQRLLDEAAGSEAMQLLQNTQKPLQRVSIPILREYLHNEFKDCCDPNKLPFAPSFERLLDDIVFLCFFVGNDFLPHLPSLDIRDGALDFLFNTYKRILPTLGDYITNHGGQVNLSHVDVILAEVGAIEDYVFQMKHSNEERNKKFQQQMKQRRKQQGGRNPQAPPLVVPQQQQPPPPPKVMGRAARILQKREREQDQTAGQENPAAEVVAVALSRGHQAKEQQRMELKAKKIISMEDNTAVAMELKQSLLTVVPATDEQNGTAAATTDDHTEMEGTKEKKEVPPIEKDATPIEKETKKEESDEENEFEGDKNGNSSSKKAKTTEGAEQSNDTANSNGEATGENEELPEIPEDKEESKKRFKEKVKGVKDQQLDDFAKNVVDNVRLHEAGWKDRYYTDKCKADDVENHGGREHMFRNYVMGLCWVMKYYYDGCPSWTWYYPFHYGPFASDLKNIERFDKDCKTFDLSDPFAPIEQLMAVLPEDSKHAIPKAARWLMADTESPIIDFYPKDVPCDPNGKAMPWLWVVLLPFIDEERLIASLTSSSEKWTKEELLCNARGLDDGYLFVHTSHPLFQKLAVVFDSSNEDRTGKIRLTDETNGSIRKPLCTEVFPLEGDVQVPPPTTSVNINRSSHDSIFLEDIDPNAAICVAFTEPAKLSHKSIMLPGGRSPSPSLAGNDLRISRPRLNRGGGTIANMGSSNGASHQSGYGSMNINSYERDVAQQTGRGGQMHQAGTRAWGAMEPTPKRHRNDYQQNPLVQSHTNSGHQHQHSNNGYNRPPWQNQSGHHQQGNQQGGYHNAHAPPPPPPNQQQGRDHRNQWQGGQVAPNYASQHQQGGYQQQQGGGHNYNNRPPPGSHGGQQHHHQQQQHRHAPPPPPPRQQGHSFRSYNQSSSHAGQNNRPSQSHGPPPSTVNPSIMNNLRSQLASTLKQNREGQGGGRK